MRAAATTAIQGRRRQLGAYTLAVVVILSLVTLIASYTLSRATVDSIRITNNSMAFTEAFNAAETGLAKALNETETSWFDFSSANTFVPDSSHSANLVAPLTYIHSVDGNDNSRSYTLSYVYEEIEFPPDYPPFEEALVTYIRVYSTATSAEASLTVSQIMVAESLLNSPSFDTPPLVVGQCISDIKGQPDIYAAQSSELAAPESSELAFNGITYGTAANDETCRNLDGDYPSFSKHLNKRSPDDVRVINSIASGATDLWDYYFSQSRAWMEARASNSDDLYWYNDADGDNSQGTFGSTDNPVIMIFQGCPKLKGTYYGLVFIEPDPDNIGEGTCQGNGWGNFELTGALIVNGRFDKWNANGDIYAWTRNDGEPVTNLFDGPLAIVPGTWTDTLEAP